MEILRKIIKAVWWVIFPVSLWNLKLILPGPLIGLSLGLQEVIILNDAVDAEELVRDDSPNHIMI